MPNPRRTLDELAKAEDAAMAPEYGILVGAIAVLVIIGVVVMAQGITDFFQAMAAIFTPPA